jgi:hypothetical protein
LSGFEPHFIELCESDAKLQLIYESAKKNREKFGGKGKLPVSACIKLIVFCSFYVVFVENAK